MRIVRWQPADDSHEITHLIFFRKLRKMLQKLPSAAVVISALRVGIVVEADHPLIMPDLTANFHGINLISVTLIS